MTVSGVKIGRVWRNESQVILLPRLPLSSVVLFGPSSIYGLLEFLLHMSSFEILITIYLFQFYYFPMNLYPYGIPFFFSFFLFKEICFSSHVFWWAFCWWVQKPCLLLKLTDLGSNLKLLFSSLGCPKSRVTNKGKRGKIPHVKYDNKSTLHLIPHARTRVWRLIMSSPTVPGCLDDSAAELLGDFFF